MDGSCSTAASRSARNRSGSSTGAVANAARTSSRGTNVRRRRGISRPIGVPLRVIVNDLPRSTPRMIAPESLRSSRWVISRGACPVMGQRYPNVLPSATTWKWCPVECVRVGRQMSRTACELGLRCWPIWTGGPRRPAPLTVWSADAWRTRLRHPGVFAVKGQVSGCLGGLVGGLWRPGSL